MKNVNHRDEDCVKEQDQLKKKKLLDLLFD